MSGKRASAMSVNQDMHALADVYNGDRMGDAEATLLRLGKRAPGNNFCIYWKHHGRVVLSLYALHMLMFNVD